MEDIEAAVNSITQASSWLDWWLMTVCLSANSTNPKDATFWQYPRSSLLSSLDSQKQHSIVVVWMIGQWFHNSFWWNIIISPAIGHHQLEEIALKLKTWAHLRCVWGTILESLTCLPCESLKSTSYKHLVYKTCTGYSVCCGQTCRHATFPV